MPLHLSVLPENLLPSILLMIHLEIHLPHDRRPDYALFPPPHRHSQVRTALALPISPLGRREIRYRTLATLQQEGVNHTVGICAFSVRRADHQFSRHRHVSVDWILHPRWQHVRSNREVQCASSDWPPYSGYARHCSTRFWDGSDGILLRGVLCRSSKRELCFGDMAPSDCRFWRYSTGTHPSRGWRVSFSRLPRARDASIADSLLTSVNESFGPLPDIPYTSFGLLSCIGDSDRGVVGSGNCSSGARGSEGLYASCSCLLSTGEKGFHGLTISPGSVSPDPLPEGICLSLGQTLCLGNPGNWQRICLVCRISLRSPPNLYASLRYLVCVRDCGTGCWLSRASVGGVHGPGMLYARLRPLWCVVDGPDGAVSSHALDSVFHGLGHELVRHDGYAVLVSHRNICWRQ